MFPFIQLIYVILVTVSKLFNIFEKRNHENTVFRGLLPGQRAYGQDELNSMLRLRQEEKTALLNLLKDISRERLQVISPNIFSLEDMIFIIMTLGIRTN